MPRNLKESQLIAGQLLAAGKSGKEIAEAVGVSQETISRWRKEPDFELYVKDLLIEMHNAARIRLQNLVGKAVAVVEQSFSDERVTSKEKFMMAVKIIEMCGGYNTVLDREVKNLNNPLSRFGAM